MPQANNVGIHSLISAIDFCCLDHKIPIVFKTFCGWPGHFESYLVATTWLYNLEGRFSCDATYMTGTTQTVQEMVWGRKTASKYLLFYLSHEQDILDEKPLSNDKKVIKNSGFKRNIFT